MQETTLGSRGKQQSPKQDSRKESRGRCDVAALPDPEEAKKKMRKWRRGVMRKLLPSVSISLSVTTDRKKRTRFFFFFFNYCPADG